MGELALILIGTVFVNNFVLVKFLGLCPVMGVSKDLDNAVGLALATGLVLTMASGLSYLIHTYVLVPLDIEYLRTLAFILVIAALVQFTEAVMRRTAPLLYQALGIFLPLITTNCAVLGVALLSAKEQHDLMGALVFGFGAAAGFGLVLVLFAGLRERVQAGDVPESFRGAPIGLVTAGLMALGFMGFSGMVPR
jgi:electron transport complex protein RnfA